MVVLVNSVVSGLVLYLKIKANYQDDALDEASASQSVVLYYCKLLEKSWKLSAYPLKVRDCCVKMETWALLQPEVVVLALLLLAEFTFGIFWDGTVWYSLVWDKDVFRKDAQWCP